MRRREFITLLGSAAAWPLAAGGQQRERMRRIGILTQYSEGDPVGARNITAFTQKMRQLGWTEGYNLAIEYRWIAGRPDLFRQFAAELVAAQPDVLMASQGPGLAALLQATRTIPIVFTSILDPVGSGLIESLARPGSNATGFILFEWSISSKWLDLLRQMAPRLTRVAVARDPSTPGGGGQLGALQTAASTLGIELRPIDSRDPAGIERAIAAFAQQPNWWTGRYRVRSAQRQGGHHAGGSPQAARHLSASLLRCRRRSHVLRPRPGRDVASRRRLCGPRP
jgi:putative ABC transport system substrate-binding protein